MKAILLTSQRTGSTFLVQCLNSHPQIRCYGEILIGALCSRKDVPGVFKRSRLSMRAWQYAKSGAWNPARMLNDFYARHEASVMIFKAMYSHLADPRTRSYFSRHTEIRVVHLRRDNLLKQYVSRVLAPKKFGRESWGTTQPLPLMSTTISPARAVAEMRKMQDIARSCEGLFSHHPKIELTYETLIEGQSLSGQAAAAIVDLLEVEPAPMNGQAVKGGPDSLELIVENYDELARALRGTEFERFLDQRAG